MKKLSWLKIIFFFAVCLFSLKAQAQASSVRVEVYFMLEMADNSMPIHLTTPSAVTYMETSAKLLCPDGRELVDTISEETKEERLEWRTEVGSTAKDVYEGYQGKYYFKLADTDDLSSIVPGTYTLTEFDCPKGYEIDEVREETYSKSIEFTQEDVERWKEYSWFEEDGYVFPIYIPLKPEGTISNYYELPPKAELETEIWNVYRKKKYLGTTTLSADGYWTNEFWYAKKKNGKWKKLSTNGGNFCFLASYKELEHGREYYFKVRHEKYMLKEETTVYGEFSDPVKVKVLKSVVPAYIPKLKVTGSGKKQSLEIAGNEGLSFYVMLYYSTEKDGDYQFISGSYLGTTKLSKIKELKKGKTWYVKAKFCSVDDLYNIITYGDFSKPIKITVK